MKKSLKNIFTLLFVVGLVTGCGCSKKEETKKEENKEPEIIVNTEENVIKDQTFEGVTFTNTSLVIENGMSTLVTQVSNNTGADYTLNEFTITVKGADGQVIATIPGYVGSIIKNGETRTIDSSIDRDLSTASSIEYSVKR